MKLSRKTILGLWKEEIERFMKLKGNKKEPDSGLYLSKQKGRQRGGAQKVF